MITSFTCFDGFRRLSSGSLLDVAPAFQRALAHPAPGPVLLFDDAKGRTIDIDTRGSVQEMLARLRIAERSASALADTAAEPVDAVSGPAEPAVNLPRDRGRPRLGVVAREVTLLPRHWDWLATQSGGASVVLRKLVEQARRGDTDDTRQRHERAYHFMSALAGDLPGFEEATRALFANDAARLGALVAAWPEDVRTHALHLAFGEGAWQGGAGYTHRPDAAPTDTGTAP